MKGKLSILIIEDDKYCRLNLREILQPFGLIEEAVDHTSATQKLSATHYDVVVTDIDLGDGQALDLIPKIKVKGSHCIVVSSDESDEVIERAYTAGASHFLTKIKIREQLPVYIHKFLQGKSARFEKFISEEFITADPDLIQDLRRLCEINLRGQNLFISGPTGAGKSLLGKLIHSFTHPDAPLVHLNCSEMAENLLESELFGHEKGAFTGADQKKDGKLKLAHGGTLFLDEIGTMSLSMQQKLLKAIDEKTFYPIGSNTPIKADFTLISATCEDLQEKIEKKQFREDLFYRICGYQFELKALSKRPDDIELLIKHFQKQASRRFVIRTEAFELLRSHAWPGNIRELRKTCEAFSQSLTGIVDVGLVKKTIRRTPQSSSEIDGWEEFVRAHGLRELITNLEKRAVENSMKRNNGKITACIKELKISSSAFYRILQEHQLHF